MSRYRIDPSGVQAVVRATDKVADGFETDLEPLPGHVTAAGGACGNSGAIVPALEEFFAAQGREIKAMSQQIEACLTGVVAATNAYVDGDLEMVQTYQRNAGRAEISTIPR